MQSPRQIAVGLALPLVFGACATMTGSQSDCMGKHEKFADVASCLRAKNLAWTTNWPVSVVKDYETRLNLLEKKVAIGSMSDEDAKLNLQDYLVRLRIAN